MYILELSNLEIGYDKSLIKNINIEAEQSELIALIGLNGIGKSTLLKTIAGIIPLRQGNIFIEHKNLKKYNKQRLASIVGFSSVNQISTTNLKIKDFVALGRIPYTSILGTLKSQDTLIVQKAIEECGLQKIAQKEITKVSDGQRQRVFIVRLIAQQTRLLLFDEPTAFLDVEGKYKIVYLFKKITKEMNKTIIFSTHDLKIAIQTADKIWLFIDNKIIEALPEDLILQGKFNKLFSDSNINFNNFTADFDVKNKIIDSFAIENKSTPIRKIWTEKALNKSGYIFDSQANKKITIFDNYWQYNTQKFDSLYKLLKNLNNDKEN